MLNASSATLPIKPHSGAEQHQGDQQPQTASTQQQPAHEAFWVRATDDPVAAFTGVLALVTTLLFIATYLLWRTTVGLSRDAKTTGADQAAKMQKSIAEAGRAATAMEGVADSMAINAEQIVESVSISKEMAARQKILGETQLRAYLSVLIGDALYQDSRLRFEARPRLVNTGSTPARNVRWRIKCAILPNELPPNFRFDISGPRKGSGFIPQGQSVQMQSAVEARIPDGDVLTTKTGGEQSLHVWGYVIYEDIFRRTHRTTFAQQLFWQQTGPVSQDGSVPEVVQGYYLHKHNRAN